MAKILLPKWRRPSAANGLFLDLSPSPSPTIRGGRRRGSGVNSSRNRTYDGVAGSSWDGGSGDDGDGDSTNSDHEDSTIAAAADSALGLRRTEFLAAGNEGFGDGTGGDASGATGVDDDDEDGDEEEGTCDMFLEAVSTGGLQEELLGNHAFEVGVAFEVAFEDEIELLFAGVIFHVKGVRCKV